VEESTRIAPGSLIYLYTDGIYETVGKPGDQPETWNYQVFTKLMQSSAATDPPKLEEIIATIKQQSGSPHFDDDVSMMQVHFEAAPDSQTPSE
jgi:serine phosphatase RsbU (regulator of sigma subunit)